MILLAVVCFVVAFCLPIIGGILMDECGLQRTGTALGIYFSVSMATVALVVLGIRCVIGH